MNIDYIVDIYNSSKHLNNSIDSSKSPEKNDNDDDSKESKNDPSKIIHTIGNPRKLSKNTYSMLFSNRFCCIMKYSVTDDDDDDHNTVFSDYIVYISNIFTSNISEYIPIYKLLESCDENKTINFVINSVGGSVSYGYGLIDKMKKCKGTIITSVPVKACSMGAMLWANGDILEVSDNAIIMFHAMQFGSYGNVSRINKISDLFLELNNECFIEIVKKGILTEKEVGLMNDGKEFWFLGYEIKDRIKNNFTNSQVNKG